VISEGRKPKHDKARSALADRREALARWLRDWASRRVPSLIDSTFTKIGREHYRNSDIDGVPASIPPDTQHVALKRVFAVEFYTPAHAEQLKEAFARLGWNSPATSPFRKNAAEWVDRSRKSSGGTWFNLGAIVSPGGKAVPKDTAVCALPKGFSAARAEFHSISSSLSCIVIAFEVGAEVEEIYECIARSPLATRLERTKRGHIVTSPDRMKSEAISKARKDFRSDILGWFTINLPGAFSASGNLELFPTSEVIITDCLRIQENRTPRNLWTKYLDLGSVSAHWGSADWPGLTFVYPNNHMWSEKRHSVIYVERSDLKSVDNAMYGGDSDEAYLTRLSTDLPGFIVHWAICALLRLYQVDLGEMRDGASVSAQSRDAAVAIRRLQRVISSSMDVSLFAAELPSAFQHSHWVSTDFVRQEDAQSPLSLVDASTHLSLELVNQLSTSDKAIRDLLVQQGNLINAMEALESQRKMSRLSGAMTWLTIAILVLTAVMAYPVIFPSPPAAVIATELN
jgi:hypothetical protein